MQESILTKLEASRRELLDLGLRNPLLNYHLPASRGVHIEEEKAVNIYEVLVKQGKAMTFLPKSGTVEPVLLEQDNTRLQTPETVTSLQNRLLNTYYAARTSLEEQGV